MCIPIVPHFVCAHNSSTLITLAYANKLKMLSWYFNEHCGTKKFRRTNHIDQNEMNITLRKNESYKPCDLGGKPILLAN